MAEEDDALVDADALADAVTSDDGEEDGEGLDPLAEEMMNMMEGEGDDAGALGDGDQLVEMEMLKSLEGDGGTDSSGAMGNLSSVVGTPGQSGGVSESIARLMDINLSVTIELGRTRDTLENVLKMGEQSLVELDKQVGEPVDVLVNGKLFARGEVVTVSENFGVRITELITSVNQL